MSWFSSGPLHYELHSLTGRKAQQADLVLVGTPQDCAYGVSLQAAAFTRKPTSAALRLFALCALRLTAHQSWRRLVCSAFRYAAESVPPSAIGSLLTAFPKRIRLALVVRVHWGMRCAPTPIRQSPQAQCSTSRWSTPMAHRHTLSFIIRLLPCLRFTAHRHRLITKSSLEASSRHNFVTRFSASRKSRKKRKPKWAAETESAFRFIGSHWRFYRTFRSGEKTIF